MQVAVGSVFDQGQSLVSLLHQGRHVATVPAEGGGAVGLAVLEMAQGHDSAAGLLLQKQGGPATSINH